MSQTVVEVEPLPPHNPALQLVRQIQRLVERNSRRWRLLVVLEGIGVATATLLAYLWLVFWLDNALHLPGWGRLLASFGLLASCGFSLSFLLRRWRILRLTDDQVALAIERRTPGGVQNSLINALQIARSSSSHPVDLGLAVVEENVSRLKEFELEQAAAARPAVIRLAAAGLCVAVGLAFYASRPERFTNAATRILLPFYDVEPLFRTTLKVSPGDIEAAGDITLSIDIQGERPEQLLLLENTKGQRRSVSIPVPAGTGPVHHTLKAVSQTMLYAVSGNDYSTRFYQITVPTPSHLSSLKAVYHFPSYTKLPDKTIDSASGNLEALRGTVVDLEFVFDQPCESAALLVEQLSDPSAVPAAPAIERVELRRLTATQFSGRSTLDHQAAYQIVTQQLDRAPHTTKSYSVRIVADQDPTIELTGLQGKGEVAVDAVLPLQLSATDDLGLNEVGLFARRALSSAEPPAKETNSDDWQSNQVWQTDGQPKFETEFDLTLLTLGAVEGELLEIVLRARDRDPAKGSRWTAGTIYPLRVGGDAAAMQLLYEQILRSESELQQLVTGQRRVLGQATEWLRRLDGEPRTHWNDAKAVAALHDAMAGQLKQQDELRAQSSATARAMVEQAGNLRFSVGMLADTEMARAVRIYEGVATRDEIQGKRAALADAQLTAERSLASLQQIVDQYTLFRHDWELAHMIGFVKMLAERQAQLRDTSLASADRPRDKLSDLRQASAGRRQEKLRVLTTLSRKALVDLGERLSDVASPLALAFATAGDALADEPLTTALKQALAGLKAGDWTAAAASQGRAAEMLLDIHTALRKAQTDAARQAIAALEERAKTDIEAQRALEKLKQGEVGNWLNVPEKLTIKDIIHMQELAAGKKSPSADAEAQVNDYLFPDSQKGSLQQPDSGKRQQFDILKLGTSTGKTPSFPAQSDREANKVTPHIQEEFEDLVGKLLEEADEMQDKFETLNLNAAFNINEPGEVGKLGGDMNSTAASAATGNKKPPTTNVGGASRSGRRGARAHGMVVGDESINRRGRDKAQEGQERVADQAGLIKEVDSDDPQRDTATGVGGKRVESNDTKFSVADAGKWTDDMAQRMGKPQDKNNIVERQDGRMDPRVAEMLRDLTSEHEQVIERVKSIRKDLKNLYLPTDHLDEILAELNSQLDSLKERPTAELFRREQQTLDKLRSTLRVFHPAHAGFQPSLPREQVVRGRVLDESDRQPPAGYESAVKRYFDKLRLGAQP